jgi:hypothetical protein
MSATVEGHLGLFLGETAEVKKELINNSGKLRVYPDSMPHWSLVKESVDPHAAVGDEKDIQLSRRQVDIPVLYWVVW